jgi:hypothetical protein
MTIKLTKRLFAGADFGNDCKKNKKSEKSEKTSADKRDTVNTHHNRAPRVRASIAVLIFIAAFSLSAFLSASPVLLVTAAGIAGFFLFRF